MYDVAIIGTGPAGLSAALNFKIHQKEVLWLGSKNLSDKIEKAEQILNYPGFPEATGAQLSEAFLSHAQSMGLEITEQMVNQIVPMGDHYALMAGSEFYESKTILFATGIATVGQIAGEGVFLGKGVSYCATCDGMLYRGKTIAVVCNNLRFEHEVEYLANLAEKVYYYPSFKDSQVKLPNVEFLTAPLKEIQGEGRVSDILLRDGTKVKVDGVFCLRSAIAMTTLLPSLVMDEGHIGVNRKQETNLPGVYAAGDCTGRPYQYTKAVGEGNVAAHAILDYLAEQEKEK